jgi:hypothetical protein
MDKRGVLQLNAAHWGGLTNNVRIWDGQARGTAAPDTKTIIAHDFNLAWN